MPKRVFKLSNFDEGIFGNRSERDIPNNAVVKSENVDSTKRGVVQGIKDNTQVNATYDARVMSPLLGDTNELIGQDSSRQFKSYDIDGDSITNIGSTTTEFAKTLVSKSKAVYAAMSDNFRSGDPKTPKWIGTIDDPPFSVANAGDQVVVDAEAKSFADSQNFDTSTSPLITLGSMPGSSASAIMGGTSGAFASGKRYFWAVSLVYDEFQESPLIFGEADADDWFQDATSDSGYADLNLRVAFNTGDFPERITGIKIYRAESPEQGTGPTSEYDLVTHIDDLSSGGTPTYRDMGITLTEDLTTMETDVDVSDGSIIADGDTIKIDGETKSVSSVSGNTLTISSPFSSPKSTNDTVEVGFDYWASGSDVGFPGSGAFNSAFFYRYRDDGSAGASYEDNTGIPETVESTSVDYAINADFGAWMFVAQCSKEDIGDAEKYVFRSQPQAYSLIDWTQNFIQLPEQPTALAGFNGRLYAFSETNMYRINPQFMQIEDVFRGVGALNENMVVTTNYGMFHADNNNIYFNDGRTSSPIGTPILDYSITNSGWEDASKTDTGQEMYASMQFDPVNRRLLVFYHRSGTLNAAWAYDVVRQRWDWYGGGSSSFGKVTTSAVGPSGTVYAVIGDTGAGFSLYSLFTGSRKNWSITTKDFDFGSDTGFVYLYDVSAFGSGNLDMDYRVDGGNVNASPTVSTESDPSGPDNIVRQFTVSSGDKKSRSLQLDVSSASGTDTLDNITVQYRLPVIQE